MSDNLSPMGSQPLEGQVAHADDLVAQVESTTWYHTLELRPGIVTPGLFDHRPYVERYGLPEDLTGLRALDVGAQDGFWSFELERRGAEVVALDLEDPASLDWPPRLREEGVKRMGGGFPLADGSAFGIARRALESSVQRRTVTIYDADAEQLGGKFDLVFCGSVLLHLRDPMLALERMAALCRGQLVLAEEYSRKAELLPFSNLAEFQGESPWMTWWIPKTGAWLAMVRCAGFEDVRRHARFKLAFARQRGGVPHVVIHAGRPAAA